MLRIKAGTLGDILIITILILCTLTIRIPIVLERNIMPAGDVFNFQHITSQIQYFNYPSKEKRLPVYPILLLPGRILGADPVLTSTAVSLLAGAGVIASLYVLGRQLAIHRPVLLAFVGLAMFDPLLTINGIRPLSDSTFILFVILTILLVTKLVKESTPPSKKFLFILGIVTTLMMFTRYEGFLIAVLLFPLLLYRVGWRSALTAAIIPLIASLMWIPAYLYIHGSFSGLAYITDATADDGGFGKINLIPDNAYRMMKGAGWARVWDGPTFEAGEHPQEEAGIRILTSTSWWLSVFALLGVPWFVIKSRLAGLPVIVAAIGYTLLLAWWWVYSRYVAPLSAIYYLSAAAGISSLLTLLHSSSLPWRKYARPLVTIGVVAVSAWILFTEAPSNYKVALANAWEGNQKGYALFSAAKAMSQQSHAVAYYTEEHIFATLYLGIKDEPKSRINNGLGVYLSQYSNAAPAELADIFKQQQVKYLIDAGDDPRLKTLVQILTDNGRIKNRQDFFETSWVDFSVTAVPVYEIVW